MPFLVPVTELWAARERARRGDRDAAIPVMRKAVDELHQAGRLGYGVWGTGVLVETLLERGAEGDLAEAQEAIDRLANLPADDGSAMLEITLLRLRALLARARGDDVAYRDLVESLSRDGGIAWLRRTHRLGRGDDRGSGNDGWCWAWRAGHAALACGRTPSSVTSAVPRLRVSADTAKYKQVTVLFADVVRSMDIAAAVDMERLREIMTELVERSAAVVQRYGGDRGVHRRRGDGAVRRPSCVGGSCFSGVSGRAGHPGGGRTGWRPRCSAATAWRCGCGWA